MTDEEKTIYGVIERKSTEEGITNGKSWERTVFTIDEKDYSTFDEKIAKEFKVGDHIKVNLKKKEDSKYWNMQSMTMAEKGTEDISNVQPEKVVSSPDRNKTMYVSYAKDIFCALITSETKKDFSGDELKNGMKNAIELIKQAKEAF